MRQYTKSFLNEFFFNFNEFFGDEKVNFLTFCSIFFGKGLGVSLV